MEDIDDIDALLRSTSPSGPSIPAPRELGDLQALTRIWVAERSAPELLSWPADGLIERVNSRIAKQIERVEALTGEGEGEGNGKGRGTGKGNFGLIVMQTELERWKFLMRGYLRARIAKIDKHTLHYLSTPTTRSLLSASEVAYATRHQALLQKHYSSSFLAAFPAALRNLDDTAGGISMIDMPDVETAVFVRLLRDVVVEGRGRDQDAVMEGRAGEVVVLRWADVRGVVERGDGELV